jgi:hypothetical protein
MVTHRSARSKSARKTPEFVHQFLVVLSGTNPLVWRRIQIPLTYSFWDLHVAIQDSMGWLDYHLHEFHVLNAKNKVTTIGIPVDEEPGQRPCIPSWQVRVSDQFNHRQYHPLPALYVYDFGDDWEHLLAYEGEQPLDESVTYPRCVSGARRAMWPAPSTSCARLSRPVRSKPRTWATVTIRISTPLKPSRTPSQAVRRLAGKRTGRDDFPPSPGEKQGEEHRLGIR